jgi:hypothetical protein
VDENGNPKPGSTFTLDTRLSTPSRLCLDMLERYPHRPDRQFFGCNRNGSLYCRCYTEIFTL